MKKIILSINAILLAILASSVISAKIGYKAGKESVVPSCSLEEICFDYKKVGYGSDYEYGVKYEIYECSIVIGQTRIEDDFEFEGDWDRCDEEGNCEPFTRGGNHVR